MIVWNKIKSGHYESEDKRFEIRRSWWPPKGLHYHLYDKENRVKKEENGFCGFCYEAVNAELCKLKAESILRRESKEVQIHPKASEYVHGIGGLDNVLHLWRCIDDKWEMLRNR